MSTEAKPPQPEPGKKRLRSPAYPSIGLKQAISKAAALWPKINRHPAPVDSIAAYLGYEKNSSRSLSEASAMIKYGLLSDDGTGDNRTVKLTDSGIKLSYNPDTTATDYIVDLQKAALSPTLHRELWERYSGHLPDDAVIKRYLVVDKKFNEQYVDDFIAQFRETISFAKLSDADTLGNADEINQPNMNTATAPVRIAEQMGQPVYPKPADRPSDTSVPPPHQNLGQSELSLPLESGKSVIIPRMTKDDFDLFVETLKLWERRIVIKEVGPGITFPAKATWKNKDSDKPVTIVRVAGQMNGETFYQSEDGTGIPAKELVFSPKL